MSLGTLLWPSDIMIEASTKPHTQASGLFFWVGLEFLKSKYTHRGSAEAELWQGLEMQDHHELQHGHELSKQDFRSSMKAVLDLSLISQTVLRSMALRWKEAIKQLPWRGCDDSNPNTKR